MSKTLRVNVVVNAKTKQLDNMFTKLNKMQNKLNQQATTQSKITKEVNRTNSAYKKSTSLINGLTKALRHLAGGYLMLQAAKTAINASDTITSAENKINYINATSLGSEGYTEDESGQKIYSQATLDATQEAMDKMYASSQRVRMGYSDMMANVSKSMTLAGKAFGGNMDNAIRFQEIMAEAYTLSGASAQEMHSSMYQMIQGLAGGVLAGDELRSVREGASLAYQKIEQFAQGIYGADKNLKDLASQGKITSDIVVKAILSNGEQIDEAFAQTSMTFAQAWTKIKNVALKSFEPVLQKMNDALNSDAGRAIIDGIGTAIRIVATLLMWVFNIIGGIFTFISDNWGIISKVLLSIAAIIGVILIPKFIAWISFIAVAIKYYAVLGAQAVMAGIKAFIAWAMANLPLLLLIAIIALVIIAVIWMSDSFADACGNIVGAVFWLGATLWNIVVGVINAIVQFLWTRFVEPWIGIIEWVLNVFNGGFDSFGDAVKNLLGNIISWFLSLGKVVTKIIDAIFGTNWTGGLESLQDKVLSWGKNENAITLSRDAPEVLHRISATDAFDKGYGYGEKFGTGLSNKLSGLSVSGLPDLGLNTTDIGDINKNTKDTADNTKLAAEDLAYLKDMANMEWKKEFTTAVIKVDMTNNNSVNGDYDLNSLAIGLRDLVEEEMYSVANGVYV